MIPSRIVITGAPGSGKTEFFKHLRKEDGFESFLFFEEVARHLLLQHPDFRTDWATFHREVYRRQQEQEHDAGDRSFVTDRGTVDVFAFHPETVSDIGTILEREYSRYTAVIQLGSSALLGEPYYQIDSVRNESPADALALEKATKKVWAPHPNYHFIEAMPDIEQKYRCFFELISNFARR